MPRHFRIALGITLLLIATIPAMAEIHYTFVPGIPGSEEMTSIDQRMIAMNTGETAVKLNVDPVVFELGANNRHWRRAYPVRNGDKLILWARPVASHEIWKTNTFVDYALRSVCRVHPSRMKQAQKLKLLATTLFSLRASKVTDESAYKMRLLSEAYQALIGLQFDCRMDYPASGAADYRVFAGRAFEVECRIVNDKYEDVGPCAVRIIAPDEWMVGGKVPAFSMKPWQTKQYRFTITPSGKSMLRPKQYPVIAELTFRHQGRKIVAHYPITVEISDPFTASLKIISADRDHINAEVTMRSLFPGMAMNDIIASAFIPDSLKIEPAKQTFSFKDNGRIHITYTKDGDPSPVLRAVTLRLKEDQHTVNLRTVMEAYLPLWRRTYGEALWMNDAEDGKTASTEAGGRRCRQTVQRPDGSRHMYFAVSPNVPTSGKTYIAVTYFDGLQGSFRLQYDSQSGAYKDASEAVPFSGTNTWKEAIFILPDIAFANRQKAESDFRLTAEGADLLVTDVIVSKFPLGDARNH